MSSNSISKSNNIKFDRILLYFFLIAGAFYFLMPLVVMVFTSVKTMADIRSGNLISFPQAISFDAWSEAWSTACIGVRCDGINAYFVNSIQLVVPAVLASTLLGALNGYIFSKWKFRGSETFFMMLLMGCFIPYQVIILPMARTLGEVGLGQSLISLILVHIIYGTPFTTLFCRNYYASIPNELLESAKLDGAHFFDIFKNIMLPLSTPILIVCVIWQATNIWNDFLFGVIFSSGESQPVTVALNNIINTSSSVKKYNVDMAAAMIAAMPTLLLYIFAGRYFIRGLMEGSVKG